jgi:archaellin
MKTLRSNRGVISISTLIILIALILVGALAAAVLVSTGTTLQQRSLRTGDEVDRGVATGVEIISVMATDGSTGADLEHFEMILRLQAGSDPMKLNDTLIVVNLPTKTQNLRYNTSAGDTSDNAATTSDYNVEWIKHGSEAVTGYITRGDLVKVRFNYYDVSPSAVTGGIGEEKKVQIKVIPRSGNVAPVEFITSKHIDQMREPLWPKDQLL